MSDSPSPKVTTYEDMKVGQTSTFGDYLITKEEIIEFATKYDPQPFHLDEAAAAKTHFGKLASSGWMTCSVMMRMLCDHHLKGTTSLGSPGVDEVRWKKPVFAGDRLHVKTEIIDKKDSQSRPEIGSIRSCVTVLNQHGQVVLSLISIALFLKKA